MKRALLNPEMCINCNPCSVIENCSMKAVFREEESDKPWVDFYHCSGCMKCKVHCTFGAIVEISHPCNGKQSMGW